MNQVADSFHDFLQFSFPEALFSKTRFGSLQVDYYVCPKFNNEF